MSVCIYHFSISRYINIFGLAICLLSIFHISRYVHTHHPSIHQLSLLIMCVCVDISSMCICLQLSVYWLSLYTHFLLIYKSSLHIYVYFSITIQIYHIYVCIGISIYVFISITYHLCIRIYYLSIIYLSSIYYSSVIIYSYIYIYQSSICLICLSSSYHLSLSLFISMIENRTNNHSE